MNLQIGDTVTRNMGGIRVQLRITAIDEYIHCGPWTFCKETLVEVDDVLQWGPQYGKSGSYLEVGSE